MKKYHLGIIPDGNRRWANQNNSPYYDSYLIGMRKLIPIFDYAFSHSFKEISVYFLSTENLKRTKADLNAAIDSQVEFISKDLTEYQEKTKCIVNGIGNLSLLPEKYQNAVSLISNRVTESEHRINLLVAYNPYYELFQTLKLDLVQSENDILKYLKINTHVDLVIRTAGGKCPFSNFLPLQCGYAFSYIINTHLNDLNERELKNIFDHFFSINPKLGK